MRLLELLDPRVLRLGGLLVVLALALSLVWTARIPDPLTGQEIAAQLAGALDSEHTLSQTFTAARNGLCSVDVFAQVPSGQLRNSYVFTLWLEDLETGRVVAQLRKRLVDVRSDSRVSLYFFPEATSRGRVYRLVVETDAPPDTVSVLSSNEDVYPDGDLRQDGQLVDGDLAFRAFTAPLPAALWNIFRQDAVDFATMLLLTLGFAGVGWSVFGLVGHWPGDGVVECALWAMGVGLALVPLLFLVFGMHTPLVLAAIFLAGLLLSARRWRTAKARLKTEPEARHAVTSVDWMLALVFLLTLVVRLIQVHDVPTPMWMDGQIHAEMVERILVNGRTPEGLVYHIGFHTIAALLHRAGAVDLPRLMVLLGQWVSALGGPAVYVLARRLAGEQGPEYTDSGQKSHRQVALWAALALALFPTFPGYLINWGRLPFLMGLALLPFVLASAIDALHQPPSRGSWGRYGLLLLLLVGLFAAHYGTLSLWVSFVLVHLLLDRPDWFRQVPLRRAAVDLAVLLTGGLLVVLLRFGSETIVPLPEKLGELITQSRQASDGLDYREILALQGRAGGIWLIAVGVCGAVFAALKMKRLYRHALGWFLVQAVLIFIQAPLLGYGLASYGNLLLALSIPLAVLAGPLLVELVKAFTLPGRQTASRVSVWAVFLGLALAGGISQLGILNPSTLLYGPADEQAMTWIRSNIPPESRFLVNSSQWVDKKVASDSGGWLEAMTGRETAQISFATDLITLETYLQTQSIDYIYLGRFAGILRKTYFRSFPEQYQLVYQRHGVEIYWKKH